MTETQKELLKKCLLYTGETNPIKYDTLKSLCSKFKSFESSFNSLLSKGYFEHVKTNDFSNQFKPTQKAINKV